MSYAVLFSLVIFLPALGALAVALFCPKDKPDSAKVLSLAFTLAVFVLTIYMILPSAPGEANSRFEVGEARMQNVVSLDWIPSFNIYYLLGVDGISLPLVLLTSFLFVLAMLASWSIERQPKAYCIMFLVLETGVLGVFLALDFFLFFLFWEVMLLPMYFLIGVWGGPRREYAAIKFFLYTLLGGVFMLVAILMLYFTSDLNELHQGSRDAVAWNDLHLSPATLARVQAQGGIVGEDGEEIFSVQSLRPSLFHEAREADTQVETQARMFGAVKVLLVAAGEGVPPVAWNDGEGGKELTLAVKPGARASDVAATLNQDKQVSRYFHADGAGSAELATGTSFEVTVPNPNEEVHTFNLLALAALGQHTELFSKEILGAQIQTWAFLLLFIGFVIKVPAVPFHTWLPDAHVEAPTPISMLLAGILLKLGGYGIIRICYPICPGAGFELAWLVCGIGVVSMVYGAFAAMAQKDFKRLVAYSSVSHMGYVVLGLGVWSATADQLYAAEYWALGMNGAMFQMIAHGISSAGMFFMVGVVYDRVHHRNLDEFGGLFAKMPVYSGMAVVLFFAGLGLPGLCGFWGEVFVTLSAWNFSRILAVVSAFVVILTAGYILWTLQRVYLGPEYKGPHGEALTPMTYREKVIAIPLVVLAIAFGVYPRLIFDYMTPSVNRTVEELAEWTRIHHPANEGQDEASPPETAPVADKPGVVRPVAAKVVFRGQPPATDAAVAASLPGAPPARRPWDR